MEQAIQEVGQPQETRDDIDRVFRANYRKSVAWVQARGVDPIDAEDIVQEALRITLEKYDPSRGAKVGSFFVTVLRSRCMDFLSDRRDTRTHNVSGRVLHADGGDLERTIEQVPDPATTNRGRFLLSILPTARQVAEQQGCLDVFDAWYEWPHGRGARGHAAGLFGPDRRAGGRANWKHKQKVAVRLDAVMRETRKQLSIVAG